MHQSFSDSNIIPDDGLARETLHFEYLKEMNWPFQNTDLSLAQCLHSVGRGEDCASKISTFSFFKLH